MSKRERIFSVCVMCSVKLPVAAVLSLAGSGTYVIHMCSEAGLFLIVGKISVILSWVS